MRRGAKALRREDKGEDDEKIICLLSVLALAGSSAALAGCDSEGTAGGTADGASSLGLSYGKEYVHILSDKYHEERISILFNKDGTGEYHFQVSPIHDDYRSQDYTVTFRYLYYAGENTAFCFYDSVEYGEEDETRDNYKPGSSWAIRLFCTEEVVYETSREDTNGYDSNGYAYINEDCLSDFPNFGVLPEDSSAG